MSGTNLLGLVFDSMDKHYFASFLKPDDECQQDRVTWATKRQALPMRKGLILYLWVII